LFGVITLCMFTVLFKYFLSVFFNQLAVNTAYDSNDVTQTVLGLEIKFYLFT